MELKLLLRRIGAEIQKAGALSSKSAVALLHTYRQLGELTIRQLEVLIPLLRGERVSMIAKELDIDPSTVRNHLSTIFKSFGVHNQSELIELLHSAFHSENLQIVMNPSRPIPVVEAHQPNVEEDRDGISRHHDHSRPNGNL